MILSFCKNILNQIEKMNIHVILGILLNIKWNFIV